MLWIFAILALLFVACSVFFWRSYLRVKLALYLTFAIVFTIVCLLVVAYLILGFTLFTAVI